MTRVVLPGSNRRAMVRGFWFVLSAITGLGVALIVWGLGGGHAVGAALLTVGLMAGFVFWQEPITWKIYRVWNRWCARPVARAASRAVLKICFLITRAAALGGAFRMELTSGSPSAWKARSSLPAAWYPALFFGAAPTPVNASWGKTYWRWAVQSGNTWSVCLLPFLALLRRLDPEGEKGFTANIYTLF